MQVIGLMSGTSVDAIDAALVEITHHEDVLHIALREFIMLPFEATLRDRVRALLPPHTGSVVEVCEVNVLLGEAFAGAALQVAAGANLPIQQVDYIASHGQTVYHQVAPNAVRSTLQLGTPAIIAERTGCTVVADFRPRDMAAGGEGAPLVPYLDTLLFRQEHKYRAIQNIGGIGNVTYLPPVGDILAFDTGPGNVLIDETVRLLSGGTANFDAEGRMASTGHVDEALLTQWMEHPYFQRTPPKSTGREEWGPAEASHYIVQARQHGLSDNNIIATITALTARSIAHAYKKYLGRVDEVTINGGGARNWALLKMLQAELPSATVHAAGDVKDEQTLNPDAKEAVLFALLGYGTLHGWPGNVPEATGASYPVVLGNITPGHNYRALLEQLMAAPPHPPGHIRLR